MLFYNHILQVYNLKLIKKKHDNTWPYDITPLLKLFTEYINEITHYILPISNLRKVIYNDFFLYGERTHVLNNRIERQFKNPLLN